MNKEENKENLEVQGQEGAENKAQEQAPKIDYEALSKPEGLDGNPVDIQGNDDYQEQQPTENENDNQQIEKEETQELSKLDEMKAGWSDLFGADSQFPEDATEEDFEEMNAFFKEESARMEKDKFYGDLPSEIQDMIEAHKNGTNIEEYISSKYRTESLTDDQMIIEELKHKYSGASEEQLQKIVNEMPSSMRELELMNARNNRDSRVEQQRLAEQSRISEQNRMAEEQNRKAIEEDISQNITTFESLDKALGIELSEADKAQFKSNFRDWVTPNSETGISPLMERLQSRFSEVAFMLMTDGDSKLRSSISKAKEDVKDNWMQKLDDAPRETRKSGGSSTGIDYDALIAPERI